MYAESQSIKSLSCDFIFMLVMLLETMIYMIRVYIADG